MQKLQCVHIKKNGKRCENRRNAHAFTDPTTFTCEQHGNVHTTLPEKDITAGSRLAQAMTNQTEEKNPINLTNAITQVFITGRYNGPDRETDAGIKVLVHGKYELVGYDNPQDAINHSWSLFLDEEYHASTIAINHAMIRMAGGTKHYFNLVFDNMGEARWVLVNKEVTKQYILVTNWAKCPRCSGRGEVTYGNVSRYDRRLHRSARTCFHCHGTGFRGAQR